MAHVVAASMHTHAHTFTHTQNDQQSITNTNCSINADTMVVHETRVGESIRRVRGLQVETVLSGTEHNNKHREEEKPKWSTL